MDTLNNSIYCDFPKDPISSINNLSILEPMIDDDSISNVGLHGSTISSLVARLVPNESKVKQIERYLIFLNSSKSFAEAELKFKVPYILKCTSSVLFLDLKPILKLCIDNLSKPNLDFLRNLLSSDLMFDLHFDYQFESVQTAIEFYSVLTKFPLNINCNSNSFAYYGIDPNKLPKGFTRGSSHVPDLLQLRNHYLLL
ncbi:hypothetical protein GEMRC1_000440 [Eukaryota sp. GEM-RC1]